MSYTGDPIIYYNSGFTTNVTQITSACNFCTLVNFTQPPTTDGTVVFDVDHFTVYTAGDSQTTTNNAPTITTTPGVSTLPGAAYSYDVDATDPENDFLTYSLLTKPSGMTINSTSGLITWAVVLAPRSPTSS